jgi:Ca-activated chloride channel family protein
MSRYRARRRSVAKVEHRERVSGDGAHAARGFCPEGSMISRTSAPRARATASVRLLVHSLLLLASCAGGHEARPSPLPTPARALTHNVDSSPEPPPVVGDVAGAAVRPNEPEIPSDLVPLSARVAARHVAIPPTGNGSSSRFTFDGGRRGWVARVSQYSAENPLTPIYGHDRVYVGGGFTSHEFTALDARTGEISWHASAPDGGPTAGIVVGDKVLFNTESCTLFAVDARTGRQRWSHWLGDPVMGQPAANEGRVFSGHIRNTGGYGFTALRLSTGDEIWTRDVGADVINAPVLDDTSVYVSTLDGVVHRFSQSTGRVLWTRNLHATSAPFLDGEYLHVTRRAQERDAEGHRHTVERPVVLRASNGETVRELDSVDAAFLRGPIFDGSTQSGWAYEGSRPTIVDGRTYQTIGNEVQSRNASTGDLLWRRRYTDVVHARPASPPAIAGALLVFGTSDGVVYGLDIDTGMTAWAYDVGEPIAAQPTVAHGWVYASTTQGAVVGLQVGDDTLDGWHMWGGNARHAGPVVGDAATPEEDDRPSEGTLTLGSHPRDGEVAGFPLESTRVSARVTGFVAEVSVEQTFRNPYTRPVEAVYLFPLPESSAVDSMSLRAGDRTVRAHIDRRERAQRDYGDARERGVLASLLEQERPNLFRESVANIRPGDSISVTLTYVSALDYEDGAYRFTYPLVAGPRYVPEGEAAEAEGDLHQVVLAPNGERPDRVEVTVDADLGTSVASIDSPTHTLNVDRHDQQRAHVTLADAARPDRDLEIRFHVAGEAPTVAIEQSPPLDGNAGTFALAIHPSLSVADDQLTPRELVFLVDTSSSMNGRPMALAQAAVEHALGGLRASDTFRVLGFSDVIAPLDADALPATPQNVARGIAFVRGMRALGATEMVSGIRAALSPTAEDGRMRLVLLLTDGYIGNETDVFRAVHESLGQSRVFALGVGSAVNRYLLTRVAEEGRGDVQVVLPSEDPAAAADVFASRIARPFLTDVSVDWGGLDVHDVYPRRLPDLFADRPLRVTAHYTNAGRGTVTIRGRVAGQAFSQTVDVDLAGSGDARPELTSMWARARVADLTTAMTLAQTPELIEEVTQIGLTHHLLTDYTAFLAVDEGYRVDRAHDGETARVEEPSPVPDGMQVGVRHSRVGGGGATGSWSTPSAPAPSPSIDTMLLGAMGGAGVGGSAGERMRTDDPVHIPTAPATAEPAPSLAVPTPPPPAVHRRPARVAAGGGVDCYAQARRPDGTIDEDALRRCLEAQGQAAMKGGDKSESAGESASESASAGTLAQCAPWASSTRSWRRSLRESRRARRSAAAASMRSRTASELDECDSNRSSSSLACERSQSTAGEGSTQTS